MKDTLKKEFERKDVQRMRNLLTGQLDAKTAVQSGYEKDNQDHKEGDVWDNGGKVWTIKNGLKQTVTKYDAIKKLVHLPISCPSCKKAMKVTDLNKKMYGIHGTCFDCVIEMETKLKAEGKFEEYERKILSGNRGGMLYDLEQALDSWFTQSDSFVSEDGVVEDWNNATGNEEAYKQLKEAIKKSREREI